MHKRKINIPGTRSVFVDIESIDAIKRALDEFEPNLLIHTAAITNIETCELNPNLAKHVNTKLPSNLAISCQSFSIPMLHFSSDHLFSGEEVLADEETETCPLNVYAKTKVEAEKIVLDLYPQALVIRTNFYGWGTSYRQSFSDFVIHNLRLGNDITLFKDVFYSPILIETLILASLELVEKNAAGIFNLVGDDRISKYDFGLLIAKKFELNSTLINSGLISDAINLVQRPHDMSLSNQKVSKLLNKKIGGISEHLEKLKFQEQNGIAYELKRL
jgi:dTDP-4-dehydrorhamnose reductase